MRLRDSAGNTQEELIKVNRSRKAANRKEKIKVTDEKLPENIRTFIQQARDKGASSWLNALPIEEMDCILNQEEFKDALRLRVRYDQSLENIRSTCACGQTINVSHVLSSKKRGFVNERHDNIKNILTKLFNKVCLGVESELYLIPNSSLG